MYYFLFRISFPKLRTFSEICKCGCRVKKVGCRKFAQKDKENRKGATLKRK